MKPFGLILPCFFIVYLACDTTPGNAPDEASDTKPVAVEPDNRIPLDLYGIYATSTAEGSDINQIFATEVKNNTWQTLKGTGPDEGIMFYFSKETYIKSVEIKPLSGEDFAKIEEIVIYGNGSPITVGLVNQAIELNEFFLSLYLRFSKTSHTENIALDIENDDLYDIMNRQKFSATHRIGVEEIILRGEEGVYKITPPKKIPGSVLASSTLTPQSTAYNVNQLFDSRREFGWVEGVEGYGKGEKIRFDFDRNVKISGLVIWNGYQRSPSHFKANSRLKSFRFGAEGKPGKTYQVEDISAPFFISLEDTLESQSFEFTIEDAYKGDTYKDLAISELLFVNDKNSFVIKGDHETKVRSKYRSQTSGTILDNILDRRIYNDYESGNSPIYKEHSAILRSDGTFVMYSREEDEFNGYELLADGNWEIESATANEARLNVFGKLVDFTDVELYYAGNSTVEMTRIFRDELTVKDSSIVGQKFLIDEIIFR